MKLNFWFSFGLNIAVLISTIWLLVLQFRSFRTESASCNVISVRMEQQEYFGDYVIIANVHIIDNPEIPDTDVQICGRKSNLYKLNALMNAYTINNTYPCRIRPSYKTLTGFGGMHISAKKEAGMIIGILTTVVLGMFVIIWLYSLADTVSFVQNEERIKKLEYQLLSQKSSDYIKPIETS